jgi:hypothetical protein
MIKEKKTGEIYKSKVAMTKHEKGESKATQKKEMAKGSPMKQVNTPRPVPKTKKDVAETKSPAMMKKTTPAKMKKC